MHCFILILSLSTGLLKYYFQKNLETIIRRYTQQLYTNLWCSHNIQRPRDISLISNGLDRALQFIRKGKILACQINLLYPFFLTLYLFQTRKIYPSPYINNVFLKNLFTFIQVTLELIVKQILVSIIDYVSSIDREYQYKF